MQPSKKLINILQLINKRLCSIIFIKLILYTKDPNIQINHIRHYDIQCQAINTLNDTLNNQINKIIYLAFFRIKFYRKQNRSKSHKNIKSNSSFIDTSQQKSWRYNSKSSRAWIFNQNLMTKSKANLSKNSQNTHKSQALSQIDHSLVQLVQKVQALNLKIQKKSPKQDLIKDPKIQKLTKQNIVLNKLNQLTNDKTSFINSYQIKQINHNIIKNIDLTNKIQNRNNVKINKHFNRTFCAKSTTNSQY